MLDVLLGQMRSAGGPVLIALVLVSVAAMTVTIFKVMQFRRIGVGRSRLARTAAAIWVTGDCARALETARSEVSPTSAAVAAVMASLLRYPGDRDRARDLGVQTALDQLTTMSRHLRILEAVVQAAPMMGLLGTVIGMIVAFGELSAAGGAIEPAALATGIWAALLTTAAGLAVAIPFYFVSVWLDSRVEEERATMEAAIGAVLFSSPAEPVQRGSAEAKVAVELTASAAGA